MSLYLFSTAPYYLWQNDNVWAQYETSKRQEHKFKSTYKARQWSTAAESSVKIQLTKKVTYSKILRVQDVTCLKSVISIAIAQRHSLLPQKKNESNLDSLQRLDTGNRSSTLILILQCKYQMWNPRNWSQTLKLVSKGRVEIHKKSQNSRSGTFSWGTKKGNKETKMSVNEQQKEHKSAENILYSAP